MEEFVVCIGRAAGGMQVFVIVVEFIVRVGGEGVFCLVVGVVGVEG